MGRFFFSSGQFLRVATGIFGFSLFGLLCWVTTAVAAQNIICVSINPFAVNSAGNVDVRYYLSTTDAVYATVYDKLGNKIVDLLTGTVTYPPGLRSVRWSQPNPGANGFYDIVLCTTQSQVNVSGEVYFDNVAPSITVSVYTATFNPLKGEALEAKYLLSENARVTVRVVSMKDATTIDKAVATLLTNACETGGVAHDFNNILGIILGYTEMTLVGLQQDAQEAENLRQVIKACHRAKDLIAQILAFSR
ncbi:MAG: histidine kinase dimerization/phospho-acceptor domain-containing protein, partial [Thermoanaerobacteraceae bacterium]|nr:histidine kinase dimerization/phospho-acceptor domain-containing protein [Thermoanaerobacteraceae bacterium]